MSTFLLVLWSMFLPWRAARRIESLERCLQWTTERLVVANGGPEMDRPRLRLVRGGKA